ncbi:MAG: hypothetical protein A2201_07190 [Alicyclobacillus sp. RIFOXYA1_FULL_53_8]|nr:MAG: hypothetical protein A2201_07190 [Alicyclobacillus sp. RIFOXYA1_FULL_53_8]
MYLDSPQNPRVREWSKLKTKRGREQTGDFIVEGIRLTEELLQSSLTITHILWDLGTDEPPDSLLTAASARRIPVIEVSPTAFASIADTVTPQGVLAIAKIPAHALPTQNPSLHALLLDGLQDPGNVGTLLRSADAFGLHEVFTGTGTADPYSPKVVRASMGGLFRLHVRTGASVEMIELWKQNNPTGQVVLAAASGSQECYLADLTKPTLLLVGSEAFGVSSDAAALADVRVRIPMLGEAESLNAAVAGSVLMYEVTRQRFTQI